MWLTIILNLFTLIPKVAVTLNVQQLKCCAIGTYVYYMV